MNKLIIIAGLSFILAGCVDSKYPSSEEAKKQISEMLGKEVPVDHYINLGVYKTGDSGPHTPSFCQTYEVNEIDSWGGSWNNFHKEGKHPLHPSYKLDSRYIDSPNRYIDLEVNGYLTVEYSLQNEKPMEGIMKGKKTGYDTICFTPTEKLMTIVNPEAGGSLSFDSKSSALKFRLATAKLSDDNKPLSFTEPAPMHGLTVSTTSFNYSYALNGPISLIFAGHLRERGIDTSNLNKVKRGTAIFVLYDSGWQLKDIQK